MDRVKRRLTERMTPEGKPSGFCGLAQEKNPPESYFAVEGHEEKLSPEFEQQPPRGGAVDVQEKDGKQKVVVDSGAAAAAAAVTGGGGRGEGRRGLAGDAVVAPSDRLFVRAPEEPLLGAGAAAAAGGGGGGGAGAEPPAWRHSGGGFPSVDFEARSSPSREGGGDLEAISNAERWQRQRRR